MLTVGGLFDGAGLLAYGLHQAGLHHAWLCESDPWRRALLHERFRVPVARDVRDVGAATAPRVDVIAGGFPCKGNSTAGKRTGLEHPETALWREMDRIVGELRPRFVLIENVANLLAVADGAVWGTVLGDLAARRYDVWWDVLPAAAFGAPHLRERVFAIAVADAEGDRRAARGGDALRAIPPSCAGSTPRPSGPDAADAQGAGLQVRGVRGPVAEHAGPAPADPECERGERRRATGDMAGQGGRVEGEARERQRGRDAIEHRDATAADADGGRRTQRHVRSGSGQLRDDADEATRGVEWGDYESAIRRWEHLAGPAPEPLVRRLDDGDPAVLRVRRRVDRQRLSALGDGVQVQAGEYVGRLVMELARGRGRVAA